MQSTANLCALDDSQTVSIHQQTQQDTLMFRYNFAVGPTIKFLYQKPVTGI